MFGIGSVCDPRAIERSAGGTISSHQRGATKDGLGIIRTQQSNAKRKSLAHNAASQSFSSSAAGSTHHSHNHDIMRQKKHQCCLDTTTWLLLVPPQKKKLKQHSWEATSFQNQTVFENDKGALFVASNSRLVVGTKESVRWWMTTDAEEGNGYLCFITIRSRGQKVIQVQHSHRLSSTSNSGKKTAFSQRTLVQKCLKRFNKVAGDEPAAVHRLPSR